MSEKLILPSKVKLVHVIHDLELNHLPHIQAIERVFQLMEDGSLNLYFDKSIVAIEQREEEAGFTDFRDEYTPPDKSKYRDIFERKMLYPRDHYQNTILENSVMINAFIQHDVTFLCLDTNGEQYHPEIGYEEIYCDGMELQIYIDDQTDVSKTSNIKPIHKTSKDRIGKPKRRQEAFKHWLKTKADIEVINPSYQECYEHIGEPTRESVWESLQKVDSRLFANGKHEFFKKPRLVNFTKGTGENRDKQ